MSDNDHTETAATQAQADRAQGQTNPSEHPAPAAAPTVADVESGETWAKVPGFRIIEPPPFSDTRHCPKCWRIWDGSLSEACPHCAATAPGIDPDSELYRRLKK